MGDRNRIFRIARISTAVLLLGMCAVSFLSTRYGMGYGFITCSGNRGSYRQIMILDGSINYHSATGDPTDIQGVYKKSPAGLQWFRANGTLDLGWPILTKSNRSIGRSLVYFLGPWGRLEISNGRLPCWSLLVVGALLSIPLWIRKHRYPEGYCQSCGYNLASIESRRCPECGNSIPPTETPAGQIGDSVQSQIR